MIFDFDINDLELVAWSCRPLVDEWEVGDIEIETVDYWAAELMDLQPRGVAGANINHQPWYFKTNGQDFLITYTNDRGEPDEILLHRGANQSVEALPDPFDFEENVWFALRLLCDPANQAYNAQLVQVAQPPIEPMPPAEVELILAPDGNWKRLLEYGTTRDLDDSTDSESTPQDFLPF